MRRSLFAGLALCAATIAGTAYSDGHISAEQIEGAIKARKAHMQLYSFHLGTLGAMAKEEMPYDAEAAGSAANALAALAQLPQGGYWLPGSDSDSVEGTRALPAIWAEGSEIGAAGAAFAEAVAGMQAAAGTDLASLQAAMGPLGQSCGGCHRPYRQSNN